MKIEELEEWFVVVNPHAGSGKTISTWKRAELMLKKAGIPYTCSLTDCKYHAVELACNACESGYRKFVAVGGDGTVHEVLGGIMQYVTDSLNPDIRLEDFRLAVIPIGSGNDWIKTHGVRNDVAFVVDLMAKQSFARQDVVKVSIIDPTVRGKVKISEFSYMVNVGGVGLDARVCRHVNRIKERGKGHKFVYIRALIMEWLHYRIPSFEVLCDGRTVVKGGCYSIAFGVGRYSGGGLMQTADAVADDGLVDLTVIKPMSVWKVLARARFLFNGRIASVPEVVTCKGKKIVVRPCNNMVNELVEVDGEILGQAPVKLEVYPQQINVLSALSSAE